MKKCRDGNKKMWVKSLEESEKGYNFALAFGNGGSAGDTDKAIRASGSARNLEKKVAENFADSKTICNFAKFFGLSETEAPDREH